jgi:hypothetical protein
LVLSDNHFCISILPTGFGMLPCCCHASAGQGKDVTCIVFSPARFIFQEFSAIFVIRGPGVIYS